MGPGARPGPWPAHRSRWNRGDGLRAEAVLDTEGVQASSVPGPRGEEKRLETLVNLPPPHRLFMARPTREAPTRILHGDGELEQEGRRERGELEQEGGRERGKEGAGHKERGLRCVGG